MFPYPSGPLLTLLASVLVIIDLISLKLFISPAPYDGGDPYHVPAQTVDAIPGPWGVGQGELGLHASMTFGDI